MKNRFDPEKFYDHTIVDGQGAVVGHVRVKPSGILWAPANAKVWYGLPITKLAAVFEHQGRKQKK